MTVYFWRLRMLSSSEHHRLMHLRPLVDTPGLAIGYDAANQWLYVDWKGEQTRIRRGRPVG